MVQSKSKKALAPTKAKTVAAQKTPQKASAPAEKAATDYMDGLGFLELKPGMYSVSEQNSIINILGESPKVLFIKKEQVWQGMPQAGDVLNFKDKKVYVNAIATYDILYPEDVKALEIEVQPEKEKTFDQLMLEQKKHAIDPGGPKAKTEGTLVVETSGETPIGSVGSTPVMVKHKGQAAMLQGLEVDGVESGMSAPSSGASL